MECLNDIMCGKYALVGVRDFINCPAPESVLFVNDIPGISLKAASSIVNEEQRTGVNLLNDKIKLATRMVFNRFSGLVSGKFDFNSIIEAREISEFSSTTNDPINKERGIILNRWRSEMAKIYIEEVYIRVKESGIAILKIYDGDVTKTYSVSLLADTNNIVKLKYKAKSQSVKIVFNQQNFNTYTCKINEEHGCIPCGYSRKVNHKLQVMGWDGDKETYSCYGVGVLANVQCYEEAILCQLLPRMAFMIWYQSGIEILNEKLASDRINAVTLFTKEQAKETLTQLKSSLEKEEKIFKNNITNFLKTTHGECFTCNGSRYAYGTP